MDNDYIKTGASRQSDAILASRELQQQLMAPDLACIMFFCSAQYDLEKLGDALSSDFGNVPLYGCTSAGEITPQGYEQKSIVAIAFHNSHFCADAQLVESIGDFDLVDAQLTVNSLHASTQSKDWQGNTNNESRFIVTLLDGLAVEEERFLNTLHSAAGQIRQFGGSAGDDVNLAKTHVYYQGKFHQDSAIVIMINTLCPFEVFSINHIHKPREKLVVTQADSSTRTVFELNAEPAALEYARLLGMDVSELSPEVFSLNPLAVKVGGQYYFRSIQKVNKVDNSLMFYCAVDTGIVLTAVELGNVFSNLSDTLSTLEERLGAPEIVLACDCFLRRLEIEHKGLVTQANELFLRHNIIGFNTYGEQINGVHLNQTFTGVYLGSCDE